MSDRQPGGGYLAQLFAYLDTPWKAVVVVLLFIIGGTGWALYQKRDEIFEAWLTPSQVALKTADVPHALERLIEGTDADLAQVWAVDLSANSQKFVGARRRDGERPVIPEPRRLPVIVTVSDIRALVNVVEGHPVCVETTDHGSPLARRLAERGMTFGCAIPVPPGPSSFVGVIYLSWVKKPEASQELVAVTAAREIASTLVTR